MAFSANQIRQKLLAQVGVEADEVEVVKVHRVRFPRLHDVHRVGAWGIAISHIEQLRALPELLRGPVEASVAKCVPNPFEVIHAFGIWHFAQNVKRTCG